MKFELNIIDIEISRKFFNDMLNFSNFNEISQFSYQSKTHFMLTCLIAANEKNGISLEEIFQTIDLKISSRSTIQKILEHGVIINFYKKLRSQKDKRIQLYYLSNEAKAFYKKWINRQKDIF